MKLITKYMTKNDCYIVGKKINPKGIMVHSTATPGVMAEEWFHRWNKSYNAKQINKRVCVHAFVDDEEVYQYLPWNYRGWHAGGSANNTHIGFEICEPGGFTYSQGSKMVGYSTLRYEGYFRKAWDNAVDLCVLLCQKYSLNEGNIICHSEGYRKKIASNHSDVMHWFPKHGENMGTFRAAVKAKLDKKDEDTPVDTEKYYRVQVGAFYVKSNADKRLAAVRNAGFKDAFLKIVVVNKKVLYRVQVGYFLEKKNAEGLIVQLKKAGFSDAYIQTNLK